MLEKELMLMGGGVTPTHYITVSAVSIYGNYYAVGYSNNAEYGSISPDTFEGLSITYLNSNTRDGSTSFGLFGDSPNYEKVFITRLDTKEELEFAVDTSASNPKFICNNNELFNEYYDVGKTIPLIIKGV